MKNFFVIFIFVFILFVPDTTLAQPDSKNNESVSDDTPYKFGEFDLSIGSNLLDDKKGVSAGFGINIFVYDNISIDYNLQFSVSGSEFYHFNAGPMFTAYFLEEDNSQSEEDYFEDDDENEQNLLSVVFSKIIPVFFFLIPEGITIHNQINNTDIFGIHIYPFGYDYYENKNGVSLDLGISLKSNISKFLFVKAYVASRIAYNSEFYGFAARLSFGFHLFEYD